MRYPQLLLVPLAFVSQVRAQVSGLSSTSVVTCLTKLGTTPGAVPLPTSSNLRSFTVNTIQKSTLTPTATSTPSHSTTTLTSTEFPITTTTVPNTIIDTFYSTSTIVNAVTTTNTVTITSVFTRSFTTTTIPPTYTSPAPPGFTDATNAQNIQFGNTPGLYGYYPKKKRALNGALAARAAASSAPTSPEPSSGATDFTAFVYPEAVSCTGIVQYFSTKTTVVSTAPTYTTTLVPITDTTSTTETTTITSSVLATQASTTSTVMTTITTTNVAPAVTQTTTQTASKTVTVSGIGPTAYAACTNNNLLTTVNRGKYLISQVGANTGISSTGRYLVGAKTIISAPSAYDCCVAQFSGVYTTQSFGAYYVAATRQCMIVTVGTSGAACNAGVASLQYFGTPTYGTGIAYTVISGTCGYPRLQYP